MRTSAPDCARDLELLLGAGGRDDAGAEGLPDLDRGEPDPSGRAVDQEPFARLDGRAPHQRRVAGLVDDEEGGGVVERHRVGNRVHALGGGDGPLGVAAPFEAGEDALAGAHARHPGADRADDARDLVAGAEWMGRLHLVLALDHEDVREVASDRARLDQDLARPRLGVRHLEVLEVRRLAPPGRDHGFHGAR